MSNQKSVSDYISNPDFVPEESDLNNLRIILEAGYVILDEWLFINSDETAGNLKYFQELERCYPEYGYLCSYKINRAIDCIYREYLTVCDLVDLEYAGFSLNEMIEREEIEGQISIDEYISFLYPVFQPVRLTELLTVHL